MAEIQRGRWTADIEGDFVVFLIGARVNNKLRAIKALRAISGMKPMLDYLTKRPEKGLLGYEFGFPTIVQYWRSFEQLEAFATDKDDPHLEVWRRYQRTVLKSGEAGIWHETFLVRAGEYEAVYSNLPLRGLAKASKLVPISAAKDRAAARLGRTAAV
jgi:Monooxygenase af470-like